MSKKFDVCKGVSTSPSGGGYAYDNPGLLLDSGSYHHGDPESKPRNRERNSFCTLTLESLPTVDSYSNNTDAAKRPSLGELHGEPAYIKVNKPLIRFIFVVAFFFFISWSLNKRNSFKITSSSILDREYTTSKLTNH